MANRATITATAIQIIVLTNCMGAPPGRLLRPWLNASSAPPPDLRGIKGGFALSQIVDQFVQDRKSVVEGRSVSVRVESGGRRIITKNNKQCEYTKFDSRPLQTVLNNTNNSI